ncbi:hypothetical protein ASPWEDRAFT_167997 [Aspergillus wentii DTO 134E9]|uniref:SET domain-containing protein n=1 Tax=Aspergillus wentii DTO 134E9 TaxID=1073089 RepID=A0A1L9RT40_ASPWE|nr:uncharacterized protein ASPWEDRAFT_167997 [Aspergillus wentii DTO 134E9]OJJ38064.1 hypothetical protein ASPWEDRAFT_167997 [Aspergillus wentii DTO 134E9]
MAVGAVTAILKPRATVKDGSLNQPWVHPHVSQSQDPVKGRQLHVTAPIATGEILMADTPYAVIPVVDDPISSTEILCSNSTCHRKVSNRVTCPNHCVPEVLWCSDICREADRARHGFECAWLKTKGAVLRSNEGEYYFGVLWLIVRVLAARSVESKSVRIGREKERFSSGWTAMKELCDNRGLWPEAELVQWRMLVEKYLCDQSLQTSFSAEEMLTLICQQESNSFGLYPRATGLSDGIDRGEQYAAAIYPRSSIANHSCCPNITHKPDEQGRMVFTASKDIAAGEECCISYFDLSKCVDVSMRQKNLKELFSFGCQCQRCVAELPSEEEIWGALPFC